MFDLPVDLCGVDFAKDLNSPECLAVNPVHSLPFAIVYGADGKQTGINGSEAICTFLIKKYRDKVSPTERNVTAYTLFAADLHHCACQIGARVFSPV